MTEQELQIAVCERMGWTVSGASNCPEFGYQVQGYPKGSSLESKQLALPPLTLELMWQAESALDGWESDLYTSYLYKLINPRRIDGFTDKIGAPQLSWGGTYMMLHATAIQRATAFIAVKQKGEV